MILDIISIAIVLGSVALLAMVVGKRLRVVASIDVDTLPSEQQASVKKRLLRGKLERKTFAIKKWMKKNFAPLGERISHVGELWNALHLKLEHMHTHSRKEMSPKQDTPTQDPLIMAKIALDAEQFDEAEHAFIEVIRVQPRSQESYRGLSDLYMRKKDFALAYESLLYLWKLLKGGGDESTLLRSQAAYDLWDVSFQSEKLEHAKKWIQEVLAQEPNNPKFLDAAIETYIAIEDRLRAERVFEALQATNPENNKLSEFNERIKGLSY
ncbi:tetratricopeptide repeat protein [Candidatus Uhrbacteria bacterium]|nr:tetratricopeptide repeat protein [Candidatus Uhrbacteria bacterium]